MRSINKLIIHCTATKEGVYVSTDTIRRWHTIENGWSDIGYHYIIELDGSIVEGRPVHRSGAHTKGHNKDSIGIAYVGGLDSQMNPKDTRNISQMVAFDELLTNLKDKYPEATIHGHNEFSSKACPSFDVQIEYKYLKN